MPYLPSDASATTPPTVSPNTSPVNRFAAKPTGPPIVLVMISMPVALAQPVGLRLYSQPGGFGVGARFGRDTVGLTVSVGKAFCDSVSVTLVGAGVDGAVGTVGTVEVSVVDAVSVVCGLP